MEQNEELELTSFDYSRIQKKMDEINDKIRRENATEQDMIEYFRLRAEGIHMASLDAAKEGDLVMVGNWGKESERYTSLADGESEGRLAYCNEVVERALKDMEWLPDVMNDQTLTNYKKEIIGWRTLGEIISQSPLKPKAPSSTPLPSAPQNIVKQSK